MCDAKSFSVVWIEFVITTMFCVSGRTRVCRSPMLMAISSASEEVMLVA